MREMVGATGFEPATPCSQGKCATKLRYAPTARFIDEFADEGKVGSHRKIMAAYLPLAVKILR